MTTNDAPTYRELIDLILSQKWYDWHVSYTDDHIVTINFWCREVDKSLDISNNVE